MKPDYIIFPDASLKRRGTVTASGYGAVILNTANNKYCTIEGMLESSSIAFCEGWAIYEGLKTVGMQKDKAKVLVVSDSKLNVMAFSQWIPHSWDLSDYHNWKKKNGEPVHNQDLYRKILKVIKKHDLKVKMVHINSHSDKKIGLREKIRDKLHRNGVKLNDSTLDVFISMNQIADDLATSESSKRALYIDRSLVMFKIK